MRAAGVSCALALASGAAAQTTNLTLDGSMSGGLTDDLAQLQPGPTYTVDEGWGTRAGANLFHSFLQFDIGITNGVPDTVRFTADPGMPALANVITRVTGGTASQIHGNLVVDPATLGAADFYFLNPAGVIFGSASSISVPNSLYVSTAHRLDFAGDPDGTLDLLSDARPDILSMQPPSAFGFEEGGPRAGVQLANAFAGVRPKIVGVPEGKTLSIVAGDVEAAGTFLRATGGRVQVVAAGEAALTVPVDASQLHVAPGDEGLGSIDLHTTSGIRTLPFATDVPQGTIVIRGGHFELRGNTVAEAGDAIGGSGASIDVETSESVVLAERSELRSVRQGDRTTGGVRVSTGDLHVSGLESYVRSRVLSFAPAGAGGGDIAIVASGSVQFEDQAQLVSETLASGANGSIGIEAGEVVFASGSLAQSANNGSGTGGDIAITAGSLTVSDAELSLVEAGGGSAGNLDVVATGLVSIEQGGEVLTQGRNGQGGGGVTITAGTLQILGSDPDGLGDTRLSVIEAGTLGSAPGGSIDLTVGELRIDAAVEGGQSGRLQTTAGAGASGAGGTITIRAGRVGVAGGGQITTTTDKAATGRPGSIDILEADEVVLDGEGLEPSGVFARSQGPGRGGDIRIEAGTIEVLDGARVSSRGDSQAANAGGSGDVDLVASESIRVLGGVNPSVVTARGSVGAPGSVRLVGPEVEEEPGRVGRVELLDGGVVDVVNGSTLPGGSILVKAGSLEIQGASGGGIPIASGLRTESNGLGAAGTITVDVEGDALLLEGALVSSLSTAGGVAGVIEVAGRRILMSGSSGSAEIRTLGEAAAGDISFRADELIQLRNRAQLLVRTQSGQNAGTLELEAPRVEITDSSIVADSSGFGGEVVIRASDRLTLERAEIVALSRGTEPGALALAPIARADTGLPAGGNVTFQGGAVVVNQSTITADGFGNANGGLIDITADPWLRSGDSSITASSQFGLQGTVAINTPYGEVTGELAALPENFLDASSLLEEPCLARDAPSGSFAVRTVGRVLAPPDAPLPAEPVDALECSAP